MNDVDFLEPQAEEQILATHIIVNTRATGETGVVNGNRITPTSPASMNITVAAGRIKISNTAIDVDEETKAMGASNATLGRMDIIIRNASGAVQVVAGSLAEVNDPKGLGNWHQYDSPAPAGNIPAGVILGAVFIAPGATAISEGDIWMFAGPVGEAAHTQGTDQGLDTGGPNAVTAAQARDAASKAHVQGTDAGVGAGGAYATTSVELKDAVTKRHSHDNKALLDTYAQTEANLADAVTKKHSHDNKALLATYAQTEANLADAVTKKHSHANSALLATYAQTEANLADAVTKKHTQGTDQGLDTGGSYPSTAQQLYNSRIRTIAVVMDNGDYPLVAGKIVRVKVDYPCTIQSAELVADQSGSAVVDIWKKAYSSLPATVANTITASAKPTLSAALKYQDATLTGWTKTIAAGEYLYFKLDSSSTITALTISLKVLVG